MEDEENLRLLLDLFLFLRPAEFVAFGPIVIGYVGLSAPLLGTACIGETLPRLV
jgi:hypothetical protein